MRVQVVFMSMLVLPVSAAAHSGPHDGIGMVAAILHQLDQHCEQGLAGVLIAASLLAIYLGVRRRICLPRQTDSRSRLHQG